MKFMPYLGGEISKIHTLFRSVDKTINLEQSTLFLATETFFWNDRNINDCYKSYNHVVVLWEIWKA